MEQLLGFDIIVFNNCVEFAMETCSPICDFTEKERSELLQNLIFLHHFKIFHLDINPSNIMYSPNFQKLVFIDFGFSETIELEPGHKVSTTFKGTPEYVSK